MAHGIRLPRVSRRFSITAVFLTSLTFPAGASLAQTFEWAKQAGSPDSFARDQIDRFSAIASDPDGNTYVTGFFTGTATFGAGEPNATQLTSAGRSDTVIAKYAADGHLLWARRAGGAGIDGQDSSFFGSGIAVDNSGNSYVTGSVSSGAVFGPGELNETTLVEGGGFLAKYDAGGALVWARHVAEGNGAGVALDLQRNIYLTGDVDLGPFDHTMCFAAKHDPNGALIWSRQITSSGVDCNAIAVDGQQNSYVAGWFAGVATFDGTVLESSDLDVFLARYDRNGSLSFATKAGGTYIDFAFGVAVDDQGNAYVAGEFARTAVFGNAPRQISVTADPTLAVDASDVFIAKYASDGNVVWVNRAGGPGDDSGTAISLDGQANVYVTGTTSGSAGITFPPGETLFGNAFVANYTSLGSFVWAETIPENLVQPFGVAADRSGGVYLAGDFRFTATFKSGASNGVVLTSIGGFDMFVAKAKYSASIIDDKVSFTVQSTSFDPVAVPRGAAGVFTINAVLTNTSVQTIAAPVRAVVNTLSGGNVLLSATEGNGGAGSKQEVDLGSANALIPGESRIVRFQIGLATRTGFTFLVDVEGVLH